MGVKDSLHGCKLTFLLGSPETSSEFRGHPRFLKGGQSSLSSDLLLLLLSSPLTSSSPQSHEVFQPQRDMSCGCAGVSDALGHHFLRLAWGAEGGDGQLYHVS